MQRNYLNTVVSFLQQHLQSLQEKSFAPTSPMHAAYNFNSHSSETSFSLDFPILTIENFKFRLQRNYLSSISAFAIKTSTNNRLSSGFRNCL